MKTDRQSVSQFTGLASETRKTEITRTHFFISLILSTNTENLCLEKKTSRCERASNQIMLFINFSRCRSFDSADLVEYANDKPDKHNLIRECGYSFTNIFGKD